MSVATTSGEKPDIRSMIHSLPVSEVYATLGTSPQGLTHGEAQERLARYGLNALVEVKKKPLFLKFLANFTHLMAVLLWVGGAMAFVARMPQLGWAVWTVIVINAVFSFWQEFRAEKATEALKKLLPAYARVLRDGQEQKVLVEQLVPGDVLILAEGDRISADARLVQESELRVDQSTLSGESNPVGKTSEPVSGTSLSFAELPNLVFAGTNVAAGTGKAVVFATGMKSEFGKIAHLTQSVGEDLSPLQREINRLTKIVTILAVGIGILFFVLSAAVVHRPLSIGFIFAVGMVVAFVPEGLLPTVTLSLAMGVQRMAKRHALIKKLSSVETLGSCTVICTDKTGTLTQNEMTVRQVWAGGQEFQVSGVGYAPEGQLLRDDGSAVPSPPDGDLRQVLLAAGLCNNARLSPPNGDSDRWTVLGDPTEAALLVVAQKAGLDLAAEERLSPRVRELPFDSRRKRMGTIHGGSSHLVYVKGAPKEVLSLCSRVRLKGQDGLLDVATRDRIMSVNDAYSRAGLRVLAIAMRSIPEALVEAPVEEIESELTFLGLMAMMDPPRPEVKQAVDLCHRAGIRIVMITGDYGLTAASIARRIGIIHSPLPRIVTGSDLDAMSDDDLKAVLGEEVIFARVAPEHKLRVVSALQELGHTVAVTGDGVNDAPALKKADIGVAMGMAGTDVAKEAADMILTDDNFASIVNAIEEGRAVYANIRKFATYIFTSNVPEAWPFIFQIMFNVPLALTVMQVLAIDLGTDLVPALALGTEAPEPGIMDRPPRKATERLVDRRLILRALVWLGSVQTVLCFAGFYFLWWTFGYHDLLHLPRPDLLPYAQRLLSRAGLVYVLATTMFHAGVVTTQIGNAYACRTERISVFKIGLFSNRFLLVGILLELAIINLLVYVQPFQGIFEHGPLPLPYWGVLALYAPAMFLAEEGRKAIERRCENRKG
ncbi:MAG: cation-translocating P-type ATPase [Betaproteobacteria bacterium]